MRNEALIATVIIVLAFLTLGCTGGADNAKQILIKNYPDINVSSITSATHPTPTPTYNLPIPQLSENDEFTFLTIDGVHHHVRVDTSLTASPEIWEYNDDGTIAGHYITLKNN